MLAAVIAAAAGYFAGRKAGGCRYVVAKQAEFIHLGHSSVVILAGSTVREMFGPRASELTLFFGFNRMVNEKGERGIVRSPLTPMSRSVRALYFSGDDWPDLIVPVSASEKQQQVVLKIDLHAHTIKIADRRKVSNLTPVVSADDRLSFVSAR
ncbi:MAG: hypothetical protein M3P06_19075 [Acidobacteriota bacterium]|nr:hypothetical protein [Acidobacteriota bacterium]